MAKTFGGVIQVYDSTYKTIGGTTNINFPALEADDPNSTFNHGSSAGVDELEATGTFKWPDLTFDFNWITGDTGQAVMLAGVGTSYKFKFTPASGRAPQYVNAIITRCQPGAQGLKGVDTYSVVAKPYGVAPVS